MDREPLFPMDALKPDELDPLTGKKKKKAKEVASWITSDLSVEKHDEKKSEKAPETDKDPVEKPQPETEPERPKPEKTAETEQIKEVEPETIENIPEDNELPEVESTITEEVSQIEEDLPEEEEEPETRPRVINMNPAADLTDLSPEEDWEAAPVIPITSARSYTAPPTPPPTPPTPPIPPATPPPASPPPGRPPTPPPPPIGGMRGGGPMGPTTPNVIAPMPNIAPNLINDAEAIDPQRARFGAFLVGALVGGTIEHIRHRRRERRVARETRREQRKQAEKTEALQTDLQTERTRIDRLKEQLERKPDVIPETVVVEKEKEVVRQDQTIKTAPFVAVPTSPEVQSAETPLSVDRPEIMESRQATVVERSRPVVETSQEYANIERRDTSPEMLAQQQSQQSFGGTGGGNVSGVPPATGTGPVGNGWVTHPEQIRAQEEHRLKHSAQAKASAIVAVLALLGLVALLVIWFV